MSAPLPAFTRFGAFALIAGGAALFLAMLYLIGSGATFEGERGAGEAHAAANGLNGYSGLVRLVEAQGYTVERSRNAKDLETYDLLVITPDFFGEGKEVGEILEKRRFVGPTLVIMPKWYASAPGPALPEEVRGKFRKGWVLLGSAAASDWPDVLPTGYSFRHKIYPEGEAAALEVSVNPGTGEPVSAQTKASKPAPPPPPGRWSGMGHGGVLPTSSTLYAELGKGEEALITDASGRVLAFGSGLGARDEPQTEEEEEADIYTERVHPVIFLVEPDLANNYGLADPQRAAAAIALVEKLTATDEIDHVTFDMTLNGFGASENLLTLAFRPPFLAATLSLLVALLIIGWRAFQRFGPPASGDGPEIAFGKRQLIVNGASLIVRARRFALLGAPYTALSARRLAERLGLARPDAEAIDAALARRLPDEEPFTRRAARLEAAEKPADILAAAKAIDDLNVKLQQGQTTR